MKKIICLGFGLVCSMGVYANTHDEQLKQDCKKVPSYAQAGLALYQKKQYAQAREQFETQVIWSEVCALGDNKIITAYNNVALTYLRQQPKTQKEKENNLLKAYAWLNLAPENSKSQYNLQSKQSEITRLQKLAYRNPVGTYWRYVGQAMWNRITITPKSKGQYQLDFSGLYATPRSAYYGPNMGDLTTAIRIQNHQATFTSPEFDCKYALTFTAQGINIKRLSGSYCGFGHNVTMQGDYVRISP